MFDNLHCKFQSADCRLFIDECFNFVNKIQSSFNYADFRKINKIYLFGQVYYRYQDYKCPKK